MKNPHTLWTQEVRRALYGRLVKLFGPYSTWENAASPGRGQDEAFDAFCESFAKAFGMSSGPAVKMQIRCGMPMPRGLARQQWNQGQMQVYILNCAAAFEMDFLKGTDLTLPGLIEEEVIAHRTPGGNELVFHP